MDSMPFSPRADAGAMARVLTAKLSFVDLAGSERTSKTKSGTHVPCWGLHALHDAVVTTQRVLLLCARVDLAVTIASDGLALEEAKDINRSLAALGNVVAALGERSRCDVDVVLPAVPLLLVGG